jgi:hypothetical protein
VAVEAVALMDIVVQEGLVKEAHTGVALVVLPPLAALALFVSFGPAIHVHSHQLVLVHLNFLEINNGTFYSYQRRSTV